MSEISLLIVDNFYQNPDEIRDLAFSLNFNRREDATYPGLEAIPHGYNWDETISRIKKYIPHEIHINRKGNPDYPQGKFHLSQEIHRDDRLVGVHTDVPEWSGVIYLSKNPDPRGGTTWYRHIPTGETTDSDVFLNYCFQNNPPNTKAELIKRVQEISKDMSQWEEIQRVAMAYNRMIMFRATNFHATNFFFGNDLKSARLSQHFVFYE